MFPQSFGSNFPSKRTLNYTYLETYVLYVFEQKKNKKQMYEYLYQVANIFFQTVEC